MGSENCYDGHRQLGWDQLVRLLRACELCTACLCVREAYCLCRSLVIAAPSPDPTACVIAGESVLVKVGAGALIAAFQLDYGRRKGPAPGAVRRRAPGD